MCNQFDVLSHLQSLLIPIPFSLHEPLCLGVQAKVECKDDNHDHLYYTVTPPTTSMSPLHAKERIQKLPCNSTYSLVITIEEGHI